jgi:arylsulfatase A-like enzyme
MNILEFVRGVVAILAAVCAASPAWAEDGDAAPIARKPAGAGRPNILFIMTDDHAAHAIGAYGSRINQTPHLDRLAKEGMRFTHAFCTNSICGPSRAVILTGKYSHVNGYIRNETRFDGSQPNVAKLLRAAGYQTAMIGKWHLGSDPTGFDYWNILPGQGVYHDPVLIEMGRRTKHAGYVTDIITDSVLDFLKNGRDRSKPFFVMYHHKAPHRPWEPDARHAALYDDRDIPEPPTLDDDGSGRASPSRTQEMTVGRHLTRTDVKQDPPPGLDAAAQKRWYYQRYIKDYLRCVASVDDNVGRVLDYLDLSGLAGNTIVIYTSDQGFFLGDHGWYDKRFMYEESLRMPLLIRWPERIRPGSVSGAMVLNLDFAQTFLDCGGAAIPADMQGRSFRAIFEGQTPADWRTAMYYRYYEFPGPHSVAKHFGMRTERYKLICYHDRNEWELFDLKSDPEELKSVYGDPQYAALTADLKRRLDALKEQFRDRDVEPVPQPVGKPGAKSKAKVAPKAKAKKQPAG